MNEFWNWFNTEAKPKLGVRAETFEAMFKYLDKFERPVHIVETGCVRGIDSWKGDGCSTVLFDKYAQSKPGSTVTSVDIDSEATSLCRSFVSDNTTVHTKDSVEFFKNGFNTSPDLLYLDSYDLDTRRPLLSEVHHVNELNAAMPMIRDDTLVAVDDSLLSTNEFGFVEVTGKGGLVAKHALEVGADMRFCKVQIGWTDMKRKETPLVIPVTEIDYHVVDFDVDDENKIIITDDDIKKMVVRARKYFEADKGINASSLYRLIMRLASDLRTGVACIAYGEACLFFARAALASHKHGTALDWYRKALAVDPRAVDYRLELATKVMRPLGFQAAGRHEALLATKIEPNNKHAWRILGGFEHDMSSLQEAKFAYDKELELDPNDPEALLDRMSIALDEPDYDTATKLAEKVMSLGRKGEAYHSLAFIAYREGRHEESIELYDKALAEGVSQEATLHWNKSLALHSIGRYREGWIEHEWRLYERTQKALYVPLIRFNKPLWKNEPPPSKIHIHMEAGAGDNIVCARYLKLMIDKGYEVRYETYGDMVGLMQRSFPDVKVVTQAPDYPGAIGIDEFDYHQPIGGLPHVFETDIDTVPWFGPYIKPDPELVEKYRQKLNGQRIGICWSAGNRDGLGLWIAQYANRKSVGFKNLEPLLKLGHGLFTSLQVGPDRSQNKGTISDLLPIEPDWDDTAALIANLDLVITVDTAVMHLAGAMGKPVWVMAQKDGSSWHLMCERPGASWNTTSPWYPTLRLFRQHRFNEPHFWDEVVHDVSEVLAQWLNEEDNVNRESK